jgi:lysophospholipase L1-like esterase
MYQGMMPVDPPLVSEPVFISTNEDGLRTPYTRAAFQSHARRIALLGDSFLMGYLLPERWTVSAQLESKLREETKVDAAVLNAGITSYSPFLEGIQYRTVVANYRPDTVILLLDVTDIGDDYKYMHDVSREESGEPRFPFSDAWEMPSQRPLAMLLRVPMNFPLFVFDELRQPGYRYYDFEVKIGPVVERNRFFIYRHPLSETRPFFDAMFQNIARLASDVAQHGARFVLAVAPRYNHWNPARECPKNWELSEYKVDEPYLNEYLNYFDEKRRENPGFEIVSLLPAFRDAKRFPLVFARDPHWNPDGAAVVASALADVIAEAK